MALNYLATRFTCSWPWSTMVLLCDGRLVCGCADPYGKRVLGDTRVASVSDDRRWKTEVRRGKAEERERHVFYSGRQAP